MNWKEKHEIEKKAAEDEIDRLIKDRAMPELEERFFKDFSCINFQTDEFMRELRLARVFHTRHAEMFPERHCVTESEPYRCYHKTSCICGFSEAYDSDD